MIIRNLLIILTISLLTCCGVTKKYDLAKSARSIAAYEDYIAEYPKSKYLRQAKDELAILYEEKDWSSARSSNTVNGYKTFLSNYLNSKYGSQAELKIKEIEELDAWNRTEIINTAFAYEKFITSFPESKYVFESKNRIQQLKDDIAWNTAELFATAELYKKYILDFPNGARKGKALERIMEIEIIQPQWDKTIRTNTVSAYRTFLSLYPGSSYTSSAIQKLSEFETKFWNDALNGKSIKLYQNYINNFPDGNHLAEAEKAIIDLEVDNIFKGNYGKLPPMSKTSSNYYYSTTNDVEIYNNTSYTLTVRYSGIIESKKIEIPPKKTEKFTIRNGDYRVSASVNAANVTNYAGKEKLEGGSYSTEYYIVTRTYLK